MSIDGQIQQIDNLADGIEIGIDKNEIKEAQEVLSNPKKKEEAVNYLKQSEAQIGDAIKNNLFNIVTLEAQRDIRPTKRPWENENPYKGAKELYEKLFNVTVYTTGGNISVWPQSGEKDTSRYENLNTDYSKLDQRQQELIDRINKIPELRQFPDREIQILIEFLSEGDLNGTNFMRNLASKYAEYRFGDNPTRWEQRAAIGRASQIRGALQMNNLWDEAKKINRIARRKERVERKASNVNGAE